jgi:hypothetical protein
MVSLSQFIQSQGSEKLDAFLAVQRDGNAYFNYVESFVGNSDLLGAHENGRWVIGFAEDCSEILISLTAHFDLIRNGALELDPTLSKTIEPNSTAYANMQRMVKKYLTKKTSLEVKEKLISYNLPTYGFDNYKVPMMSKNIQTILSYAFGVLFVITILIIALTNPSPTDFQYTVFRIVLSLAAGGVVAVYPGFIEVKLGKWLRSGGAFAVFVLVYFYSPAAMDVQSNSELENRTEKTLSIQ